LRQGDDNSPEEGEFEDDEDKGGNVQLEGEYSGEEDG